MIREPSVCRRLLRSCLHSGVARRAELLSVAHYLGTGRPPRCQAMLFLEVTGTSSSQRDTADLKSLVGIELPVQSAEATLLNVMEPSALQAYSTIL